MTRFLKHAINGILLLLAVTLLTGLLIEVVPGDPAVAALGPNATEAEYERVRTEIGLDKPFTSRYSAWVKDTVRGEMGHSLFPPKREVRSMLAARLPVTLQLALMSLAVALIAAIPVALLSAAGPRSRLDVTATGFSFAVLALPSFVIGLLIVFLVIFNPEVLARLSYATAGVPLVAGLLDARRRGWSSSRGWFIAAVILVAFGLFTNSLLPNLPRQGFARITEAGIGENLRYLVLPVATLALTEFAVFVRILRTDLLTTLQEDYITVARSKGLPRSYILLRHALRPSCVSLVTLVSVTLGRLIGGSVVVESLFNIPGVGRMLVEAIVNKDFPVVQAGVLVVAAIYVVINIGVDAIYGVLDPRVRTSN